MTKNEVLRKLKALAFELDLQKWGDVPSEVFDAFLNDVPESEWDSNTRNFFDCVFTAWDD